MQESDKRAAARERQDARDRVAWENSPYSKDARLGAGIDLPPKPDSRTPSDGELAALGLNPAGTGFPSPTAHAATEEEMACTSDRYQVIDELIDGNNQRAYLLGILNARLADAKKRAAEAQARAVSMIVKLSLSRPVTWRENISQ